MIVTIYLMIFSKKQASDLDQYHHVQASIHLKLGPLTPSNKKGFMDTTFGEMWTWFWKGFGGSFAPPWRRELWNNFLANSWYRGDICYSPGEFVMQLSEMRLLMYFPPLKHRKLCCCQHHTMPKMLRQRTRRLQCNEPPGSMDVYA